MATNIEIVNVAVTLIVKAAILAPRFVNVRVKTSQ